MSKNLEDAPTKEEVSILVNTISGLDFMIHPNWISILRRLAFDWNLLKYRLNHQTQDDIENCKRGLHKDCGK